MAITITKMADTSVVVNDLLCFTSNKFGKTALKILKSTLVDFYDVDNVAAGKLRLTDDIDTMNLTVKRPHTPLQRDSNGRLAREVDDILQLFTFLDEHKTLDNLPKYVANGPDSMPSVRLYEGELQVLMVLLRDMEGWLKTVESSLAAICNDIRTVVLPESVAPKQPRGQGSARPTQGQHK